MFAYPYKICDPIHNFIRFGDLEKKVIDSVAYQRLRYIRQMGVAYLIYPGATHTRFEHSLGVMEFASRIYDTLMNPYNLQAVKHIQLPTIMEERYYWRQILRLASLCHDLGHLPFSHTAEKSLLPAGGHESMTIEIIRSKEMKAIWKAIPSLGRDVEEDVIKLSTQQETASLTAWEKVLTQIITDDNFGADRIDYLIRDAHFTGIYGHFDYHQLVDSLRFLPKESNQLTLGIFHSGMQSVESLWFARYLMHARVYQHPKSKIYSQHMHLFMKRHYERVGFPQTVESYLEETDYVILTAVQKAAKEGDLDAKALLKQIPDHATLEGHKTKIKADSRLFSVLNADGSITESIKVSPFLRDIPLE